MLHYIARYEYDFASFLLVSFTGNPAYTTNQELFCSYWYKVSCNSLCNGKK